MGASNAARSNWIDYVKCLAILAVVVGHTYSIGNPIHSFAYSFHIPLFFIVSGYLAKAKKPDYAKLASRLLVPYFLICVSTLIVEFLDKGMDAAVVKDVLLASIWASGGTVPVLDIPAIGLGWFLMALFVAKIIFQSTQCFLESRNAGKVSSLLVYLCMLLLGWGLGGGLYLPFALNQAMVAAFYLYVGYRLKTWSSEIGDSRSVRRAALFFMSLAVWFSCLSLGCFYSIGNLFHVGPLVAGIAMSLSSSVAIILAFQSIDRVMGKRTFRLGALIGANSLLVLCVHWFEGCFVDWGKLVTTTDSLLFGAGIGALHVVLVVVVTLLIITTNPVRLKTAC